ncbi:hypothetical protein [Streptomyces scabichelini]|uniref:hypothetical protein n=1 Tax=Streptomyces scabichelini TaxID=2711217 RepID=UPI0019D0F572|nr:hypothetical protein [Streptomyces scabichelini]
MRRSVQESDQRAGESGGDWAARDIALATLLRALDALEWRPGSWEQVLGGELTLADVQLWVTLVHPAQAAC